MEDPRIILDSGALSALAEKGGTLRLALSRHLTRRAAKVCVPAVVLAEATTGDHRRDAAVNQALKSWTVISVDGLIARSAAALRFAQRRAGAGTIDAIVVATADMVPGSDVLTTDHRDLALLAGVRGCTRIVAVAHVLRRRNRG